MINTCIRCPQESVMERKTSAGTRHLCHEHAKEYLDLIAYQDIDPDAMYDIDFLVETLDDVLHLEPEIRYDNDPQYFEAVIDEAQIVVNAIKRLLN